MATRRAPHRAARLRPYFWSQCFPYIHQPLSTKNNEIRLMILEPAHNLAETLLVRLVHVRLANNTPYFALSYVWGDPAPKDFVLIGDRKLGITENLGKALRRIRQVHPDAEVVLWADGICINQHSIIERNHQVGIMGSIYKGAAEVFVWIDEYLDTKSPLFEQIMARRKSASELSAPILLSDCSNSCLVNVINVFQNPYWKRLWVQGELINAAKLRVLFRNCVMFDNEIRIFTREIVRSLHGMLRYVGHLRNLDEQLMDALRYTIFNYVGIGYHALAEESGQHWAQERLTDLMHHGRILSVTKPRDFVFGLMHIANDYNDGDIKVDYEKSVQEVFLLAFHHHVGWHRDLRFLDIVQYGDPDLPRVAMEFPEESWMQVWTNRSTLERSWPAAAIPCLADAVSCSSNVIHVHGFTLSSLSKVTTMLPEPGQTEHSLIQQMTRLFEAMPSLLQSDCLGSEEQVNSLMEILEADGLSDDWGLSVFENVLGALNVYRTLRDDQTRSDRMVELWDSQDLNVDFPSPAIEKAFRGILWVLHDRSLVRTETGQFGVSRCQAIQEGDEAWIIFGCDNPMILRPSGEHYLLMGAAYFPDFKDGILVGGPEVNQEFKAGDDCNGHIVRETTIW